MNRSNFLWSKVNGSLRNNPSTKREPKEKRIGWIKVKIFQRLQFICQNFRDGFVVSQQKSIVLILQRKKIHFNGMVAVFIGIIDKINDKLNECNRHEMKTISKCLCRVCCTRIVVQSEMCHLSIFTLIWHMIHNWINLRIHAYPCIECIHLCVLLNLQCFEKWHKISSGNCDEWMDEWMNEWMHASIKTRNAWWKRHLWIDKNELQRSTSTSTLDCSLTQFNTNK